MTVNSNIKQTRAVKAIASGEVSTLKEALILAGYSETVARNPHLITKTASFKELMQEYLPDELVAQQHRKLLNKTQVHVTKDGEIIPTGQIDANAVAKGLDMYYKIKGSYAPTKSVNLNLSTSKEHKEKAKKALMEVLEEDTP
jgi:hypothetical protein